MSRSSRWFVAGFAGYLFASWVASSAQARPNYNAEFQGMFPDNKATAAAKCGVCHGAEKKIRNSYGMAVGAALGGPKVANAAAVKAAIENANGKPSSTPGMTFGDQIKAGMLPK